MFKAIHGVEPKAASEQAAYSKWLDQTTERQTAAPTAPTAPKA